MRLPEVRDKRRLWLALFPLAYIAVAGALWRAYGMNAFFITMVVGSMIELAWTLRLSLKRWN